MQGLGNYKKLMEECWSQEPDTRPAFDKIAARLKAMIRWRMVIKNSRLTAGSVMALTAGPKAARAAQAAAAAKAAAAAAAVAAGTKPAPRPVAALGASVVGAAAAATAAAEVMREERAAAVEAVEAALDERQHAHDEEHERDHDPLPVPDHPIAPADGNDVALPPLPEGDAEEVASSTGAHLLRIMSVARDASANVLVGQQADDNSGLSAAAAADDSDASPFEMHANDPHAPQQQQQQSAAAARAALAAAAAAHHGGASVIAVPGAAGVTEYVVLGSDVTPGSPYSAHTLSTKNSTDVCGMSVDTAGLSTPAHSVLTAPPNSGPGPWELQPQVGRHDG